MTQQAAQAIVTVALVAGAALVIGRGVWKLFRDPQGGCRYPFCPLDGSHCLKGCDHRRGEHSDFDGV